MYPSNEQIKKFIDKTGTRGHKTLTILGTYQPFINAINHPIGQELLKDLIDKHESCMVNALKPKATDIDKIKYQVATELLLHWCEKIANYERRIKHIIDVVEERTEYYG